MAAKKIGARKAMTVKAGLMLRESEAIDGHMTSNPPVRPTSIHRKGPARANPSRAFPGVKLLFFSLACFIAETYTF
jgi:hypothetical protein